MKRSIVLVFFLLISAADPLAAEGSRWLIPPVDAVVSRAFDAPGATWGPGHRGIDYAVVSGTAVRASGSGKVTFAGRVADVLAVTIDHGSGLETTYSRLSAILVSPDQVVGEGTWIGRAGEAHPGEGGGLHFGVKLEGAYVDPVDHLMPLNASGAFGLVPVIPEEARAALEERFERALPLGAMPGPCRDRDRLTVTRNPPNHNVAVAIAGIGSRTKGALSADMYENGPELLGYPESRIYRFSYRGTDGPDLHEPYESTDTYGDLIGAALGLREQMRAIALLHPGAKVDLIAHSQGGVVARAYLQLVADRFEPTVPQVEHLVTFSTPHEGAPLAGSAMELMEDTLMGGPLLDAASGAIDVLPDPRSDAVEQLAPDSDLMRSLAAQDLPFGTRALTMTIPHDVVVPADRTDLEGTESVVVAPAGLNGHSAIVSSSEARALAYSFLAGGAAPCGGAWDDWGRRIGRLVGAAEGALPTLVRGLEDRLLGPIAGLLRR